MRSNRFVVACRATSALATGAGVRRRGGHLLRVVAAARPDVGGRRAEGARIGAQESHQRGLALLRAVRRDAGLGRVGHGRPLSRCRPEGGAVLTIFSCPCIAVKPH